MYLLGGLSASPDSIQVGGGLTCIGAGFQHQHCQISISLHDKSRLALQNFNALVYLDDHCDFVYEADSEDC